MREYAALPETERQRVADLPYRRVLKMLAAPKEPQKRVATVQLTASPKREAGGSDADARVSVFAEPEPVGPEPVEEAERAKPERVEVVKISAAEEGPPAAPPEREAGASDAAREARLEEAKDAANRWHRLMQNALKIAGSIEMHGGAARVSRHWPEQNRKVTAETCEELSQSFARFAAGFRGEEIAS